MWNSFVFVGGKEPTSFVGSNHPDMHHNFGSIHKIRMWDCTNSHHIVLMQHSCVAKMNSIHVLNSFPSHRKTSKFHDQNIGKPCITQLPTKQSCYIVAQPIDKKVSHFVDAISLDIFAIMLHDHTFVSYEFCKYGLNSHKYLCNYSVKSLAIQWKT